MVVLASATLTLYHAFLVSSLRDSDRILGILQSKSHRAEQGEQVEEFLLLTRYCPCSCLETSAPEGRIPAPVQDECMKIMDLFRRPHSDTAGIAKERLQIIVAHERAQRSAFDFLPALEQELLAVIRKYVEVDKDQVEVQLDKNGNSSVLALNVTLPELPVAARGLVAARPSSRL